MSDAELLFQRAVSLRKQGQPALADAACGQVIALNPRHFSAYHLRGLIALERGELDQGIGLIEASLRINPDQSLAHSNLGNALLSNGQAERALECLDRALQLNSGSVLAHYNRGNVLRKLGRYEAALAGYDAALIHDAGLAPAHNNRGLVLVDLGRLAEAADAFERAVALDPRFLEAQNNRAAVLLTLGRDEEASRAFEAVLGVEPRHAIALENLFHLRMASCEWGDYESLERRLHESLRHTKTFINPLSLLMFDDADMSLASARAFSTQRYPQQHSLGPCAAVARTGGSDRIRVAYVSADFCEHPVSQLLVGVLEHHDRQRFDVIGVYLKAAGNGAFDSRVRDAFDECIDVSACSDVEAARLLRQHDIDIAVDLMGFTEKARLGLFAHRAAPVQVTFLGYAGTLGAPYMDYLLADDVVIPPDRDAWCQERVLRLPGCYLPNDDRRPIADLPTRAEAGLPEQGLVFCAFTKAHKINPPMFAIWMRLLSETTDSVLWLSDMGAKANAHLQREAASRGIDVGRLIFAARLPSMADHLGRLALADLYLDTLPHNAHSTTCDALWAGVPVLTAAGKSFPSRVAASALRTAGLPELVTASLAAYRDRAIELAREPARLRALRAQLTRQRRESPLFRTADYTRQLEMVFAQVHELSLAANL